jgi:hypothetical protein
VHESLTKAIVVSSIDPYAFNDGGLMDALQKVIRKIHEHSNQDSAAALKALVESLDKGAQFDLGRLYQLNYKDFELALELIKHWRLDSYRYERGWASRFATDGMVFSPGSNQGAAGLSLS